MAADQHVRTRSVKVGPVRSICAGTCWVSVPTDWRSSAVLRLPSTISKVHRRAPVTAPISAAVAASAMVDPLARYRADSVRRAGSVAADSSPPRQWVGPAGSATTGKVHIGAPVTWRRRNPTAASLIAWPRGVASKAARSTGCTIGGAGGSCSPLARALSSSARTSPTSRVLRRSAARWARHTINTTGTPRSTQTTARVGTSRPWAKRVASNSVSSRWAASANPAPDPLPSQTPTSTCPAWRTCWTSPSAVPWNSVRSASYRLTTVASTAHTSSTLRPAGTSTTCVTLYGVPGGIRRMSRSTSR
ncbi:hypothetical protein GCM10023263_66200 [Phytohabitans rumicis]